LNVNTPNGNVHDFAWVHTPVINMNIIDIKKPIDELINNKSK